MRLSTRTVFTWLAVGSLCLIASCGGDTEDDSKAAGAGMSEPQPVSADFELPSDQAFRAQMTGGAEGDVSGQSGSIDFRRRSDEIVIELASSRLILSVNYTLEEGQMGTFTSVKTPQLTYESTQYNAEQSPVRLTVETFSNNTFRASLAGSFGGQSGEAIQLKAKMDFEYEKNQRRR